MRTNPRTVLLDQYEANRILLGSSDNRSSFIFLSGKLRGLAEALCACGYHGDTRPLSGEAWLHDCERAISNARFGARGLAHE